MTNDLISRQAAIDALDALCDRECEYSKQQRSFMCGACRLGSAFDVIDELPSAQPEQRYTEEELRVFQHGISLSLLSKRSAQHWHYDEDTATEIKFLERLYEKVCADIRGEEGGGI